MQLLQSRHRVGRWGNGPCLFWHLQLAPNYCRRNGGELVQRERHRRMGGGSGWVLGLIMTRPQPGNTVYKQLYAISYEFWRGFISEHDDRSAAPTFGMRCAREFFGKPLHPEGRQINAPKLRLEVLPLCNGERLRALPDRRRILIGLGEGTD